MATKIGVSTAKGFVRTKRLLWRGEKCIAYSQSAPMTPIFDHGSSLLGKKLEVCFCNKTADGDKTFSMSAVFALEIAGTAPPVFTMVDYDSTYFYFKDVRFGTQNGNSLSGCARQIEMGLDADCDYTPPTYPSDDPNFSGGGSSGDPGSVDVSVKFTRGLYMWNIYVTEVYEVFE